MCLMHGKYMRNPNKLKVCAVMCLHMNFWVYRTKAQNNFFELFPFA